MALPMAAHAQGFPSAKEMEEGMRRLQQELEKLPPEQRRMLDQQMSQMAAAASGAGDDALVPARDAARISKIPRKTLKGSELKAYVEQLQPKLLKALAPRNRERAQRIEAESRKGPDFVPRLRAVANGLAAWGAWPEATYLMGRLARETGNAQDLNNFAAFLSMQRAEHAAIPILQVLDARYPNNSTVLNNLGQAWFGLGEQKEAERYLAAAVKRSPNHPQANLTRSRLEEARGDKAAAVASVRRSIKGGYSEAKEQRLNRLGAKLGREELRWTTRMPQDPLGLERFELPPYPAKALDLPVMVPLWKAFREGTRERAAALDDQYRTLQTKAGAPTLADAVEGPLGAKARRLGQFTAETNRAFMDRVGAARKAAIEAEIAATQALDRKIAEIDAEGERQYRNKPGGYQKDYTCKQVLAEIDRYLSTVNAHYQKIEREWLAGMRQQISEAAYLSQFQMSPQGFEAAKVGFKRQYAEYLNSTRVALYESALQSRPPCFVKQKPGKTTGKLPDFDDIHCDRVSTFSLPGTMTIVTRCNKMETTFDPIYAPFKVSWTEDLNRDRVLNASAQISFEGVTLGARGEFDDAGLARGGVEVGVGVNAGKVGSGPLEIGVDVGVSAGVEFDRSGITDVTAGGGVGASATGALGKTYASGNFVPSGPSGQFSTGASTVYSYSSGFSGSPSAGFSASAF